MPSRTEGTRHIGQEWMGWLTRWGLTPSIVGGGEPLFDVGRGARELRHHVAEHEPAHFVMRDRVPDRFVG